jgi:phage terminase large subunit-like protein
MDDKDLHRYATDPGFFIDHFVRKNELGQPFQLMDHEREFLRLAFTFDNDKRLPWDQVVYSAVKKSGKTFFQAVIILWWAFTQEAPNELIVTANDFEQVQARVFKTLLGLFRYNPNLAKSADITGRQITLSNGTTITAIASEYAGAAGSNHGFTGWDELWGYISEASRRLWEELTPVPTRRNSIRFISSYAGWENESGVLRDLYKQGVGPEEHPEGQGERLHPDLPIFCNRDARLIVMWDHEPRMPWQTDAYYAAQRRSLRPGTYLRLHENRWTTSESTFITPELWDPCVDAALSPPLPTRNISLYVGVDAGIRHDFAAVVTIYWKGDKLALGPFRIWRPSPSEPLDLEHTIEEYLRELAERYTLVSVLCDPYQLHRSITTLHAAGLPIAEFPQTTSNTTRMGQSLFDLLEGHNLKTYPSESLRAQALATVAIENSRGWRIAKERASRKIDAIVALAMACVAALDDAPPGGITEEELGRLEERVAVLQRAFDDVKSMENGKALADAKREYDEQRRAYIAARLQVWF